jgi:hypothetical protein
MPFLDIFKWTYNRSTIIDYLISSRVECSVYICQRLLHVSAFNAVSRALQLSTENSDFLQNSRNISIVAAAIMRNRSHRQIST